MLAVVFAFALQIVLVPKAHATSYNLTPSPAPGECNVYDAINAINSSSASGGCEAGTSSNTINLAAGTYTLVGPLPDVTFEGDLDLIGAEATSTIIDGANFSGISFSFPTTSKTIKIQNLTLQNFKSSPSSAAVIVAFNGNLIADHLLIHDNDCSGPDIGVCYLFVNDSGDGLSPTPGEVNISITNSSFYNNQAKSIIVAGNASGTGFSSNIINNTFYNNIGVILSAFNAVEGTTNTTNFVNNTVANNEFPLTDFGYFGWISINSAVSGSTTNVNVKNNIFSSNKNYDTKEASTCFTIISASGHLISQGGNIVSDSTCAADFTDTNDKNSTDPLLGTFSEVNNTWVIPLLANSPAIDNGIAGGLTPSTDQRGVFRPQGSSPDSGAYELELTSPGLPNTGLKAGLNINTAEIIAGLVVLAGIGVICYSLSRR